MVRKARAVDCEEIWRICSDELGYACESALIEKRIHELDECREAVFAAEADNRIVGFVHVEKYRLLYFKDMANILGLAVAKNYQRRGIGKELLKEVEQWARDNNMVCLRLNSGMRRAEAHKFYRAMGFLDEKDQIRFMKQL